MAVLNPDGSKAEFGSDRGWKTEIRDGKFWSFMPGSKFTVSHYEYCNIANIDEFGGRRVPRNATLDGVEQRKLLPLLGDSFTFGVGVEDEETFANKLSARLLDARILNLGVPGTGLTQQIDIVRRRHIKLGYPTHYVFFFFIGNDFNDILSAARNTAPYSRANAEREDKLHFLDSLNEFVFHNSLLKHSYFIQLFRQPLLHYVNSARVKIGSEPEWDPVFYMMNNQMLGYQDEARSALDEQLAGLKELQGRYGFTSMIVAIPDRHQLGDRRRQLMSEYYKIHLENLEVFRPNRILRKSIEAAGLAFFDSTDCLAATGLGEKLYYQQDNHLRAIGHDALANCVVEPLEHFLEPHS